MAQAQRRSGVRTDAVVKVCEQSPLANARCALPGVGVVGLKLDGKTGYVALQVCEAGRLNTYINPTTGQHIAPPGRPMPMAGWEQDDSKTDAKGDPIDKNGVTESGYVAWQQGIEDSVGKMSSAAWGLVSDIRDRTLWRGTPGGARWRR